MADRTLTGRSSTAGEVPWPPSRPGEASGTPPGPIQAMNRLGSVPLSLSISLSLSLLPVAGTGGMLVEKEGCSPPSYIAARGGSSPPLCPCEGGRVGAPFLDQLGWGAAHVRVRPRRLPCHAIHSGGGGAAPPFLRQQWQILTWVRIRGRNRGFTFPSPQALAFPPSTPVPSFHRLRPSPSLRRLWFLRPVIAAAALPCIFYRRRSFSSSSAAAVASPSTSSLVSVLHRYPSSQSSSQ